MSINQFERNDQTDWVSGMVTNSRERVEHMLAVVRELTGGRGTNFFLFLENASLAVSDPLTAEWISGRGERVRLTD